MLPQLHPSKYEYQKSWTCADVLSAITARDIKVMFQVWPASWYVMFVLFHHPRLHFFGVEPPRTAPCCSAEAAWSFAHYDPEHTFIKR